MIKSIPSSITAEEAVARMINLDYIPTGFSLLEMTAAYLEEAEVAHHNARIDHLSEDQLSILKTRMDGCRDRHSLAQSLLDHLHSEIANPEGSMVVRSNDSSSQPRLTLESVSNWAFEKYGINISEWSNLALGTRDNEKAVQNVRWEEVTIKIYENYRIGCFLDSGKHKKSSFRKLGLIDKRKNAPDWQGGILIGLSKGEKFPATTIRHNKHATAISKLRRALKQLTGLSSDPFAPFTEADGWKPRFKLIDDQRNADERAKRTATPVSFNETRDFDDEADAAQDWLDQKG